MYAFIIFLLLFIITIGLHDLIITIITASTISWEFVTKVYVCYTPFR